MYFPLSFCVAAAFLFAFPRHTQSRATGSKKQLDSVDHVQHVYERNGARWPLRKGFGKRLVAQTCVDDDYLREFQSLDKAKAQEVCNILLELPAVTVGVDVTPTT